MYRNIAIPVDGSAASRVSLRHCLEFAKEQGARVRLIHVLEPIRHVVLEGVIDLTAVLRRHGQTVLDEALQQARGAGVEATAALVEAGERRIADAIVDEAAAARADLIAIGTHGRRGIEHLVIGSVAEGVAVQARIPVLLIRNGEKQDALAG
jgi:nucleotide-binding universal stress UspA family protein